MHRQCYYKTQDYNDTIQVRNCRLVGLRDLKGSEEWVRQRTAGYLNQLIDDGVAGFRLDAAKHMWPRDIYDILSRLHRLNTEWFPNNTTPFIYQEVRTTRRYDVAWCSNSISKEREEKKEYLYSAFIVTAFSLKARRHGSHSFTRKLHHACISFVSAHRMAPPLNVVANI